MTGRRWILAVAALAAGAIAGRAEACSQVLPHPIPPSAFEQANTVLIGRITALQPRKALGPNSRVAEGRARAAVWSVLRGHFEKKGVWFPYRYENAFCVIGDMPEVGKDYVLFIRGRDEGLTIVHYGPAKALAYPR
jgi:hypothetical protein